MFGFGFWLKIFGFGSLALSLRLLWLGIFGLDFCVGILVFGNWGSEAGGTTGPEFGEPGQVTASHKALGRLWLVNRVRK